jgi:hypothetical protein
MAMPAHDLMQAPAPATGGLEPPDIALLDDPLEYIHAEHQRQRAICTALRAFATQGFAPRADADRVISYLTQELPLHHEDEDVDFYPVLRRRCSAADDLDSIIARLSEDHRRGEPVLAAIIRSLAPSRAMDPVSLDHAASDLMHTYALGECSHLAVENGVVLAIARIRLTRADIRTISHNMKVRRGMKPA